MIDALRETMAMVVPDPMGSNVETVVVTMVVAMVVVAVIMAAMEIMGMGDQEEVPIDQEWGEEGNLLETEEEVYKLCVYRCIIKPHPSN